METNLANLEARLINLENMLARMQQSVGPSKSFLRLAPTFIDKLRPALEEGGILADGRSCSSTDLRDFSRSWRYVINNLRFPANHPARIEAESLLSQLNVIHYKEGNRKMFCEM